MGYRFMRIILFFDLPMNTREERRKYNSFRTAIKKEGFIMMQESVYCKLSFNKSVADSIIARVKALVPNKGLIQIMIITEKQYSSIINVIGESKHNEIDSDEQLVVL